MIEIIRENLATGRHMENMRNWQFQLLATLIGSSTAFLVKQAETVHRALRSYSPWFLLLALLSLWTLIVNIKWSMEFRNCIRCISWASEKLRLIWPISDHKRDKVRNHLIKKECWCENQANRLLDDAAYQGYAALSVAIDPISVHKISMYGSAIIFSGMTAMFAYGPLSWIAGAGDSLDQIGITCAIVSGLLFLMMVLLLWSELRRIERRVDWRLDTRMPDGIKLYYRSRRPFYETDP